MQLAVLSICFIDVALLAFCLIGWLNRERLKMSQLRNILFSVGLAFGTGAAGLFIAFYLYTSRIGGFGTDFASVLKWTRLGFWLAFAALVLCLTGKERGRRLGCTASMMLLVVWTLMAWGS